MRLTLIAMVAMLIACTTSSTFDVVVTDDNHVTVWDSSGRGYSVPLEDITIHGMENLPEPTATLYRVNHFCRLRQWILPL